jgi:hypothetical protein
MAQWAFPFADNNGDRVYSDADFALFYDNLFTNGVIATIGNALRVTESATSGMRVIVKSGAAILNGRQYLNSEDVAINVPVASTTQNRTDSVILRLDIPARDITLAYKQGDTTVRQDEEIYELQLATINVDSNTANILNRNITDKRSDESVCGYSTPYEELSVSGLEQQYHSMLQQVFDEFVANADNNQLDLEQLLTDQQALFQTWLSGLQDELDSNQAGNLQNQINQLTADNQVVSITHNLGKYPDVQVLYWEYGLGTVPLDEQPEGISFDGTAPETIPVKVVYPSRKRLQVQVPIDYAMTNPSIKQIENNEYILTEGIKSMKILIGVI